MKGRIKVTLGTSLFFSASVQAFSILVEPFLYSKKDTAYTYLLLQKWHVVCYFNFTK